MESFIQRQLAMGYKDPDEVARQALLRWMAEDEDTPPGVMEKLARAAQGQFAPGDRSSIQRIVAAA